MMMVVPMVGEQLDFYWVKHSETMEKSWERSGQSMGKNSEHLGVSINGGTPIAGWYVHGKSYEMDNVLVTIEYERSFGICRL